MKLLGIGLIALLLAGCAVVPVPAPAVYGPSVSVGVAVPAPVYPRYYYPYRHWN